jgi:hypothetical protein
MNTTHDHLTAAAIAALNHYANESADQYNQDDAAVFAIAHDGSMHELAKNECVYEALQDIATLPLQDGHAAIGVCTTGWAAPIGANDDTSVAPSEHPKRVRCHLIAVVDRSFQMATAVSMQGDDEVQTNGAGEGELADCLCLTMLCMMRVRNKRRADA